MKKILILMLVLALLCGCGLAPSAPETPGISPTAESTQAVEMLPEQAPAGAGQPEVRSLAWATAFRSNKMPEGAVRMDEVAFYSADELGRAQIVNVSKAELEAAAQARQTLPRSRYFEQYLDPALHSLLPVLDYALEHSCSRMCCPTTEFSGGLINTQAPFLNRIYRANGSGVQALSVCTVEDNGIAYDCVLVTIPGMEKQGVMSKYRQGLDAARDIVDGMPRDLSEREKVTYLYNYLTEHVRYDYEDYYLSEYSMLYDALVRERTVCAGYAEAMYYLCSLAGVECLVQYGWVKGSVGTGAHAWNIIRIDGQWYLFDATWDEGVPEDRYLFFGLSDQSLQRISERIVSEFDLEHDPACPEDLPRT